MQVVAEQGPEMSADALKAMTYLEVVIKEMQRLHPIVGGVFRKATEDFELPGGFYIPKVPFGLQQCRLEHVWLLMHVVLPRICGEMLSHGSLAA